MFRKKQPPADRSLEQEFAAVALKMGVEISSITPDGAQVKAHGEESWIGFANVRPHWESAKPADGPKILAHFLTQLLSMQAMKKPETLEAARASLLPRIAPSDFGMGPGGPRLPKWDLVPDHISVFLVIDYPETVLWVDADDLKKWNATFEDAYAIAFENLRRKSDPRGVKAPFKEAPFLRMYMEGDAYDAARALLLGDFVVPWPKYGALFVVPTRDVMAFVIVNGPETIKSLNLLININQKMLQNPSNPISGDVFWYDGNVFDRIALMRSPDDKLAIVPPDRFNWALMGRDGPPVK